MITSKLTRGDRAIAEAGALAEIDAEKRLKIGDYTGFEGLMMRADAHYNAAFIALGDEGDVWSRVKGGVK
jgi:hypothetical protein